MKRFLTCAALVLCIVLATYARDDLHPITGSTTAASISITNTTGLKWITTIMLGASSAWTNSPRVTITLNNGDKAYALLSNTNASTSAVWIDEADAIDWMDNGVLTLGFGASTTVTNFYRIKVTTQR